MAGDNSLDVPELIQRHGVQSGPRSGPGTRLARASVVAVGTGALLLCLAAYCILGAPIFRALAGGVHGWLEPLAAGSDIDIDALFCRALWLLATVVSLWGSALGALSRRLDHGEVDRRWLGMVGIVAGLLIPALAPLALWWAWVVAARAHFGGP